MLVKIANAGPGTGRAGAEKERIRHMKVRKEKTLATKMAISLVAGLTAGLLFLFLREHLNSSGQEAVWTTINDLLFQDITAAGASSALGLFYLAGQMFIRALQLVIVPMVFTSITLAIGQISDTSTLGRISFKCIKGFLICSFFALLMACVCGIVFYNMGVFHVAVDGLESVSGSQGANPLLVVLNIIPSNIASTFSSNTAVLAVVFLAVSLGLCMKTLGEEKTATLRKLIQELNDVVIVFLNFVVSKFGPVAIFMLLTRTFASYGVEHLKPAVAYVILTVVLLLIFLIIGYPAFIAIFAHLDPFKFAKKITRVAVFGFSTSSSAATLPLNVKTTVEELGVDEKIASFVLPLGMTINMNGTAIMQVIATLFIAGCAGYSISFTQLVVIALLVQEINIAVILIALFGACLGFIPYNMNPAKIFMGDTGSTFLGYILATLSVTGLFKLYAIISFAVPFLILGLPIFDICFAFLRRIARGQNPMVADRGHVHHRLIDMGFSQKQAVAIAYMLTGILGLAAVLLTSSGELKALILIAAIFIVSAIGFKLIFSKNDPAEDASSPEPEEKQEEPHE